MTEFENLNSQQQVLDDDLADILNTSDRKNSNKKHLSDMDVKKPIEKNKQDEILNDFDLDS